MVTNYLFPIIGLIGMIVSYYSIRKTRDKRYFSSLAIFVSNFCIDLFWGQDNTPNDSILILKLTLIALGWLVWFITRFSKTT